MLEYEINEYPFWDLSFDLKWSSAQFFHNTHLLFY